MMDRWTHIFDADSIAVEARRDIASCLRMLADAVDAGQIDATLIGCEGNGFANRNWRDTRAHLIFKMDLAAEVRTAIEVPNQKPRVLLSDGDCG